MPFVAPEVQLTGIAPELTLVIVALVLLIGSAALKGRGRGEPVRRLGAGVPPTKGRVQTWYQPYVASLGLVIAGLFALASWGEAELQLADMIALDSFAVFVKVTLVVFALLTVWLAREYLVREGIEQAEFYGLVLLAVAGMMLLASAADLIVMFLALEMFSIALYVLVGFRGTTYSSQEAAMKYFLLGAFSSAFFLLGIALVYGAVGSTNLYGSAEPGGHPGIIDFLATTPAGDVGLLVAAAVLLVIGLGFKVSAVPFHAWTPDAYQGAPAPVTGFMAAASKLAGFAALLRLFDVALFPLRWDWQPLVIGIAIATMAAGSILAVVQEDLKRLLAYSSIAHAGFVLMAVAAANDRAVSGALFYLATYGIAVLGAFAVVSVISGKAEHRTRLADFRGLYYEQPLLAGALTLFLLSLAGVPLTAGFVGKLVVFAAAVEAGFWWLVVIGVLTAAIAAFFYLRIMVVMYMQEPAAPATVEGEEPAVAAVPTGSLSTGVVAVASTATLFFGIYWGPLIRAAEDARIFFAG
jgi:NADH-quinone oxidoreductase subunit N